MAPLVDMQTQTVHSAGQNVCSLSDDAGTAGRGFLSAVTSAQECVVHPTVSNALGGYHGTWSQPANRMQVDVDALGANTSGSAADVSNGNADATAAGQAPAVHNQDLGARLNGGGVLRA